jgi:hypothetical protein
MGSISLLENCGHLIGSEMAVLEAFAPVSMAGLRHRVRHKIESVSDSRVLIEWLVAWRKMGPIAMAFSARPDALLSELHQRVSWNRSCLGQDRS